MITFAKATKTKAKLRMAIDGPSGSGKTYTALIAAMALKNGGRVAVIDTERGSAAKYADLFDFDTLDMRDLYPRDTFDPLHYIEAISAAEAAGYDVLIIDSLSHAWEGEGGVLDQHDMASKKSGNSYTGWKDVSPLHRKLIDAMLNCGCHVIATMRSKMEYILVENEKGKQMPKKVGMAPVQRQGMEYEFDIVADMDQEHTLIISKSRCFNVADKIVTKPTVEFFAPVKAWLSDGAQPAERKPEQIPAKVGANGERVEQGNGGNGDKAKPTRPYDPTTLKKGIAYRISKTAALAADDEHRGAMVGALEALFPNDSKEIKTAKRRMLLKHLCGVDSSKDLTGAQVAVLLGWASERLDSGEFAPDAMAMQEAALVVKAADVAAGQQELL